MLNKANSFVPTYCRCSAVYVERILKCKLPIHLQVIAPTEKPRYGSQMSCMLPRELIREGVAPPHEGMTQ